MPIASTNRKAGPYAGTGTLVALPFAFKVFGASDLRIVRADALGNETTLTIDVDYTVALNANQDTSPGGTVTLITPLATGYTAIITSEMANLQPTDLTNQGGFYPKVITNALDRLTILVQQLAEKVSRALKYAITSPLGDAALPVPVANNVIGWNAEANGFRNFAPANNELIAVSLASDVGASYIGIGNNRTQADKNAEAVSVADFSSVQEAVTYSYINGKPLYWPNVFEVTGNITNFHGVQHYGPGGITRGADTFLIEPNDAETNTIYVATDGNDANDGLSASFPLHTLAKIKSALINTTANQRGGTWTIKFAAGTYSDSTNFPDLPIFRNALRFIGTGSAYTPQTIFDGTSAAYQTAGMYFLNKANIFMQYIKFANFVSGYGVLGEHGTNLEFEDCDADACNIGFSAGYSSFIRTTRCTARNCTGSGFRTASNGQASFAPSTELFADANRAYSCGYGFTVTRVSYAHIDNNIIEDSTYAGIIVEINSRSAVLGNNFKRNAIGIRCWTSGYVSLSDTSPNVFNQGTADANIETYEYRGSSGDLGLRGQSGTMLISVYKYTTPITVTGTLSNTVIRDSLFTALAGWFIDNTKRVIIKVFGTVTTPSDGTISLQMKLAGTALSTLSVPSSITAQPFCLTCECYPKTSSSQNTFSTLLYNGGAAVTELRSTSIACDALDREFSFYVDPNGAGALTTSITVESIEVFVCG